MKVSLIEVKFWVRQPLMAMNILWSITTNIIGNGRYLMPTTNKVELWSTGFIGNGRKLIGNMH